MCAHLRQDVRVPARARLCDAISSVGASAPVRACHCLGALVDRLCLTAHQRGRTAHWCGQTARRCEQTARRRLHERATHLQRRVVVGRRRVGAFACVPLPGCARRSALVDGASAQADGVLAPVRAHHCLSALVDQLCLTAGRRVSAGGRRVGAGRRRDGMSSEHATSTARARLCIGAPEKARLCVVTCGRRVVVDKRRVGVCACVPLPGSLVGRRRRAALRRGWMAISPVVHMYMLVFVITVDGRFACSISLSTSAERSSWTFTLENVVSCSRSTLRCQ